jgi:hypothetical protein
MGKFPIVYHVDLEVTKFIMETLGFGDGNQPKLAAVEEMLKGMTVGDEHYFMLWVIYVVSSVLAPNTGTRVCPKCYPSIMDPSKIKDLNWCRFVIMVILEVAKSKGTKNPFTVCMLFFQVDDSHTSDFFFLTSCTLIAF